LTEKFKLTKTLHPETALWAKRGVFQKPGYYDVTTKLVATSTTITAVFRQKIDPTMVPRDTCLPEALLPPLVLQGFNYLSTTLVMAGN
jgi:hypothetical protein